MKKYMILTILMSLILPLGTSLSGGTAVNYFDIAESARLHKVLIDKICIDFQVYREKLTRSEKSKEIITNIVSSLAYDRLGYAVKSLKNYMEYKQVTQFLPSAYIKIMNIQKVNLYHSLKNYSDLLVSGTSPTTLYYLKEACDQALINIYKYRACLDIVYEYSFCNLRLKFDPSNNAETIGVIKGKLQELAKESADKRFTSDEKNSMNADFHTRLDILKELQADLRNDFSGIEIAKVADVSELYQKLFESIYE